jgi:hypothetical protein
MVWVGWNKEMVKGQIYGIRTDGITGTNFIPNESNFEKYPKGHKFWEHICSFLFCTRCIFRNEQELIKDLKRMKNLVEKEEKKLELHKVVEELNELKQRVGYIISSKEKYKKKYPGKYKIFKEIAKTFGYPIQETMYPVGSDPI